MENQEIEWTWYDGADLPMEGRGYKDPSEAETMYDRLPVARKDVIPPSVWELQRHSSGLCFRFKTQSSKLRIFWKPRFKTLEMWHMPSTGASGIDVYQYTEEKDWQYVRPPWPDPPKAEGVSYTWEVKAGAPTMIYLPLYNGISEFKLGIEPGTKIEPLPVRKSGIDKPAVFYGTSITQGGCVSRPGLGLTSVAGRVADVPAVNLGFSGSGRMELEMIDVIADVEASVYVLDTIANVVKHEILERYEKFIKGLRARRPGVPIITTANGWIDSPRHHECAEAIKEICEKLWAEDPAEWKNLYFTGDYGTEVAPDAEGTVDGVHVNDIGSVRAGIAFGKAIKKALRLNG